MNSWPDDKLSNLAKHPKGVGNALPEDQFLTNGNSMASNIFREQLLKILVSQSKVNPNWLNTWARVMKTNNISQADVEALKEHNFAQTIQEIPQEISEPDKFMPEECMQATLIQDEVIEEELVNELLETNDISHTSNINQREPIGLCVFCNRPIKPGTIFCKCGTDVGRLAPTDIAPPPTCSPKLETPPLPKALSGKNIVNKLRQASNNNTNLDQNPRYSSLFLKKEEELI